jgi:valyl-tRNA synthetase
MTRSFADERMPESPLTPTYDPAPVEARWSALWEQRGFFRVDASRAGTAYCIVIPPPNITGSLHLGHALNITLQDILIRWRRMCGDGALWIPGTDHAGIATQNVVERQLKAEKIHRDQLGRAAFIQRVWQWRNESGRTIITQLKKLAASCDWSRERFTMDDGLSAAVREVFVRLYQDGLIYRSERLINWCPRCQTALSDIEVEHEDVKGRMYSIRYPLADHPEDFLTVATTRPETMLGDTAVAVHPDDPRFNRFIGQRVRLPLTGRTIPVVGDAILVDREFGTGAVKITPGHDFNDYEAGKRHQLAMLSLLDRRGLMTEAGLRLAQVLPDHQSALQGRSAIQARELIVPYLQEEGVLIATEDHRHAVGRCYRCKTIVEPRLSPQWFVNINAPERSLAAPAIEAVRSGRIRLIPESWANNYFGWMEQIQDWCISRQIWWGHQIPAWYCKHCMTKSVGGSSSDQDLMFSDNISLDVEPIVQRDRPLACPTCGSKELVQDPDVLDTWFSSALWPFSTLGWPRQTQDLARFYPTSALVTSFDILFFWVARMIMMGLYVMKEIPFRDVYIHALVRDADGQKMSKSKGNVIDPLEIMNKYGTDALRFTLASMASPGRDIRLAEERIAGYRNFANKIWNAARFALMNLPEDFRPADVPANTPLSSVANTWIRSRLHRTIGSVNRSLDAYRFDEAAACLYQFIWHEFCDWYLELMKVDLQEGADGVKQEGCSVLVTTFETVLRLLHPFMPFISEELWAHFPHTGESLVVAAFPQADPQALDGGVEDVVDDIIIGTVTAVRNLRAEINIPPGHDLPILVNAKNDRAHQVIGKYGTYIKKLARVHVKESRIGLSRPKMAATVLTPWAELYIPLDEEQIRKEIDRLRKSLAKTDKELEPIEKKFGDHHFVTRAPKDVVSKLEAQRTALHEQRRNINAEIEHKQQMLQ